MNISEKFTDLIMSEQENYSDEVNQYIRMHNKAISDFAQSVTISSVVSLLIKKGILTDDEITGELTTIINENQSNIKQIEDNRNIICQLIEYEAEYAQNLKDMHNDLANREGIDVTLSADASISVREDDSPVNTTDAANIAINSFIE